MLHQTSKSSAVVLFLFSCAALFSQVPDGGLQLNRATGTTYQKIGRCTVTEVTVTDQDFTEAIRVQTGADMVNSWDAQLKFPAVAGVEEGDVVLVAFSARTTSSEEETGDGFLNVIIEHNVSYVKQLQYHITIGTEWREYYAPAQMGSTLSLSEVSYLFHMGFNSQTVEVAEVRFLNFKDSLSMEELPITEITYVGREPDAAWRAPAEERIGQIRKGLADITFYNDQGEPIKDAEVHIEMIRHHFGFGTAVTADRITTDAIYRDTLFEIFNEAVFENDLKWPRFEQTSTHAAISKALDTLDAHQIPTRGHNVIWPSYRYMPSSIEDLGNDPEAVRVAIEEHIDEVTTFTSGRLNDWDVINEPISEHVVQDMLGDEVMADWFRRTRMNDRGVKCYLNDYLIISGGGKNTVKQDQYYNMIRYIDSLGGGIDGIGMQGHMGGELTSIVKVYEILDRFAVLGKEIKITEHDIAIDQREVQADYTRDFMTIAFSHPAVRSLLVWGFWAGAHWEPDAAFFDRDWNIRPHGEVWKRMIKNEWWTPRIDTVSGDQGELSFDGFLGTYSYRVSDGITERTGTFTLDHSHQSGNSNDIVISMDASIPESVQITPGQQGFICMGETISLHAPQGDGLTYAWSLDSVSLPDQTRSIVTGDPGSYRVTVSKSGISVTSEPFLLEVRTVPEIDMQIDGELTFCPGESVTFSVDPQADLAYEWYQDLNRVQWGGASFTADQSGTYSLVVSNGGCTAVSEPVAVTLLSETDPRCYTGIEPEGTSALIFPNPCRGSVRVELGSLSAGGSRVELYDATGKLKLIRQVEPGFSPMTIPVPAPGLYMLRIFQGGSVQNHRLIAE